MAQSPSTVLLTRPLAESQQLQQLLAVEGINAVCQPLFEIVPGHQLPQVADMVASADIIIAVSKHAVQQAGSVFDQHWPERPTYIAVGPATQAQWQQQSVNQVVVPNRHDSEGLLELPQLQQVAGLRVVILRGQAGRELLAQQLTQRHAQVSYCECYQRRVITLNSSQLVPYWQQQNVNCLVVTSAEQLTQLIELCRGDHESWLYSSRLLTVSKRIAALASNAGFNKISVSDGASNAALKATLMQVLNKAKSS
ncbi:uroporphyrinogen-III synthase [Neiella marina]|uniref:Uroporphyrinogen-III synthase n=1 Tax=Neiella holothuriorum TaxID=2870530 RepID=A0ABS7ECJ9_9GAMM|nr:uroporphyrinogen-III synthase [Neiella holothuriorum]MBW8189950.1 uroporphyrinogen-III synthase [Neiella holothuriorum]